MKKSVLILLTFALVFFIVPMVSAEILVGQPNALYNLGDDFNLNITLSPANNAKGFFTAKLICSSTTAGDIDVDSLLEDIENNETDSNETDVVESILEDTYGEVEIYRSPENILGGTQKVISISTSLDSFFIGDLKGDCLISASYNNEVADSQSFGITKNINVELTIDGYAYDPGSAFQISGRALKGNNLPLDGFATISVPGLGLNISTIVEAGDFGVSVNIPSNAISGEYSIFVTAYEKDELDETINEGKATESIRVEQIVSNLGIALNEQSIIPGTDIIYTILLFDQAGNEVTDDVKVVVYDTDEEVYSEGLVKAGSAVTIPTQTNYIPGYWTIEAFYKELSARKAPYLEVLEKISSVMTNSTLTLTNIGNVIYDKEVEISIGEEKRVERVFLEIGESKSFELEAPAGEYEISVSDGTNSENLGVSALTGKAVSVNESGGGIFSGLLFWLWLIIILIVIGILVYFYRRKRKKMAGESPKIIGEPIASKEAPVTSGKREEAVVVALNIKNPQTVEESSGAGSPLEAINSTLLKAKESNTKIYIDGEYRIILLTPSLTKSEDNTVEAVKIAQMIEKSLNSYNETASNKIEFGVGVNVGSMIVESKEGKFKFTSVGNTITLAKRIASQSKSEILISDPLHGRVAGKVKSVKTSDSDYRKVTRVVDRGRHSAFISKFKSRLKEKK